ncbi:hypothetical protein [Leminorella grimontii]
MSGDEPSDNVEATSQTGIPRVGGDKPQWKELGAMAGVCSPR